MAKILEFTSKNVMAFASDLEKAFQEVAKAHGVKIELGNIKYQSTEFNTPLKVKILSEDGSTQLRPGLMQLMDLMGIQENGRDGFKIVDYNGRKTKGWIFTKPGQPGQYVCDDAYAKRFFAKPKSETTAPKVGILKMVPAPVK